VNAATVDDIRPPFQAATTLRAGVGYWLSSLWAMLRFDYAQARQWAGMMVSVQVMLGAGMAEVYGFFYPHVTPLAALYIATGTPTLALIPLGFSLVPNAVGQQKLSGTFEFIWSQPVPRSAQGASTFLLYTALALPGMVLALVVSAFRYGVHLSVSPEIVPAALLCSLMAISVGFSMALAIPKPLITNLITNALNFVVLLFSPIVFPLSQLPGWLADIHRVLPFYNMAVVIRAGLTHGIVTGLTPSFLILGAWTVAGWGLTAYVVGRRR
jgi:ABC-2 type transport system permease protein